MRQWKAPRGETPVDTHALLWWLADDPRLGADAKNMIADPANDVLVSVASFWEIVVKVRVGKVRVGKLRAEIGAILEVCARHGFASLDITPSHLRTLAKLPIHHRDPFDHLLIAQSIAEDASLLTQDARAANYPARVISCPA